MKVLLAMGVNPAMVRAQTAFILGKGDGSPDERPTLTPRASKVIDLAMEQAARDNRTQVTTIDLLVAPLTEGEGVAAAILWEQGVNLERLRSLAQKQA